MANNTAWGRSLIAEMDAAQRLINEEMNNIDLYGPLPVIAPWRRRWNHLRYVVSHARERLGEWIAGRRFDDD